MPKNIKKLLFFISISSFLLHPSITMEGLSENETGYTRQREIQLEKIVEIAWKNFNRYGSCGDKGYTGLATQYFSTGGSQIVLACQYEFCTYHRTGLQEVALRYKKEYESASYDLQEFRRQKEEKERLESTRAIKSILSKDIDEMSGEDLFYYACMYDSGKEVTQDKKIAFELAKLSAERGYQSAQNYIGNCYLKGHNVMKDEKKAVEWYLKAEAQGYFKAQYALGECYEGGYGVMKDKKEAVKLYLKVKRNIYCDHTVYWKAKNKLESVEYRDGNLYLELANGGDSQAQYYLGRAYFNGYGFKKNKEEAVKWYIMAANKSTEAGEALKSLGYKYNHQNKQYENGCNIF